MLAAQKEREGVSFPNFVARSMLKLPLSKLCAVPLALQNRAPPEGERGAKGCREKGRSQRLLRRYSLGTALQKDTLSSKNKLPFMILNPPEKTSGKCPFPRKNALSCRKMQLPAEKKALSCRKMHFPVEKCGSRGAHRRKPQEIAGLVQGSRIKNAGQLSQERPCGQGKFSPSQERKTLCKNH